MPAVKAVVEPELRDGASTLVCDMEAVPLGMSSIVFMLASVKNKA